MTPWQIPVILRVILANGATSYLQKKITGMHSRPKRLAMMFSFCTALALILAAYLGELTLNMTVAAIAGIGFINAIAAYFQWCAIDLSLTKNSLFTFWDDIIAMTLSMVILNEGAYLNVRISIGIALSFLALILFVHHDFNRRADPKAYLPIRFYAYIAAYSVIWGVAMFLIRYWAFNKVPLGNFVSGWYGGAFLGALCVYAYKHKRAPEPTVRQFTKSDLFWVLALSAAVVASLTVGYWAFSVAPQIIVQPLFLIGEMIVPALMGLFVFHERKKFSTQEWLFLALGMAGGVLIALK